MQHILLRWFVTTIGILVVPQLISGVTVKGFGSAVAAAAILGVLNACVRPILIILTLPLTVVTLGLFILIINALLFQLAGAVIPGMMVDSFWSALWASIIVSIVSWLANYAIVGTQDQPTIVVQRRQRDDIIDLHRGKGDKWE